MNPIRCCKDCTRRHVGCHGTCEDYIQENLIMISAKMRSIVNARQSLIK